MKAGAGVIGVRRRGRACASEVSGGVFDRMGSERKRVAKGRGATGAAESEKSRADADRQRDVLIAEAYRDAQKVKGEGDAKASSIYASAFGKDPQFAQFYRSLEAYRASFRTRSDLMVVDPSAEFFRYLKSSGAGPAAPAKGR